MSKRRSVFRLGPSPLPLAFAAHVARARPFRRGFFIEADALAFVELVEVALNGAAVKEPFLPTVIADKTKAPVANEPLDRTGWHRVSLLRDVHRNRRAQAWHRVMQVVAQLKGQLVLSRGQLHVDVGIAFSEMNPLGGAFHNRRSRLQAVLIDAHVIVADAWPRRLHVSLGHRGNLVILDAKLEMHGAFDGGVILRLDEKDARLPLRRHLPGSIRSHRHKRREQHQIAGCSFHSHAPLKPTFWSASRPLCNLQSRQKRESQQPARRPVDGESVKMRLATFSPKLRSAVSVRVAVFRAMATSRHRDATDAMSVPDSSAVGCSKMTIAGSSASARPRRTRKRPPASSSPTGRSCVAPDSPTSWARAAACWRTRAESGSTSSVNGIARFCTTVSAS